MKIPIFLTVILVNPIPGYAQDVQRSSSPSGIQIQGSTTIQAQTRNVSTTSTGADNKAKTSTGTISDGVRIQGNTRINAQSKEVHSIAVGKGNQSDNAVGAIGGK